MSSAISRFTTALLAGSQENTFALAALNFDFSLYKVEAPKEFQVVGTRLTEERRNLAENGSQHITARKLGALFRSKIPRVSALLKVYGQRVSEITRAIPETQKWDSKSLFPDQLGIDATSIWAAATSGSEALAVQLLACMLARIWSGPQAVSIWTEIIEGRKHELEKLGVDDIEFSQVAAMQANVTREQLGEWDASVRAWLKTADTAKTREHTQMRLIIENLDVPVNDKPTTYDSVMEAWISAMSITEDLVSGIPQRVHDGAALIGLSAWHLYPDMSVYQDSTKEVTQSDHLIPRTGLLTLGLKSSSNSEQGVRWSLPLSRMRYYGDPVIAVRRLDSSSSRVPFGNMFYVALGCLSRSWSYDDADYRTICTFYKMFWELVKAECDGRPSWLEYLSTASDKYLSSLGEEHRSIKKLIGFGNRQCKDFLGRPTDTSAQDSQLFDLDMPGVFIQVLRLDFRIQYLRNVVEDLPAPQKDPRDWIIVYKQGPNCHHSYCTAVAAEGPSAKSSTLPDDALAPERHLYHCRWEGDRADSQAGQLTGSQGERTFGARGWDHLKGNGRGVIGAFKQHEPIFFDTYDWKSSKKRKQGLQAGTRPDGPMEFGYRYLEYQKGDHVSQDLQFDHFLGDPGTAALYRRANIRVKHPTVPSKVSLPAIIDALQHRKLSATPFLTSKLLVESSWRKALRALCAAAQVYKPLEDVTCSMAATKPCLSSLKWVSDLSSCPGKEGVWWGIPSMSRAAAFACITYFETGYVDLDPEQLKAVMAISVDNSLFVSSMLVADPYESLQDRTIQRALGNVGKPGVTLLVPPPAPRMRELEPEQWNLVNHEDFNFRGENSFEATSLHLWLTEYRVPYAIEHGGKRDHEAFIQEAVVSIHDRAEWIADLDVIKALHNRKLELFVPPTCACKTGTSSQPCSTRLTSIDNWAEMLDRPDHIAVVRSHGNWLGRLATASLASQLDNHVVILPRDTCGHLYLSTEDVGKLRAQGVNMIIQ